MANAQTIPRANGMVLHITDIDADVDETKMKKTVGKVFPGMSINVEVSAMRLMNNGNLATTIRVNKEVGEKLAQIGKLQIGWTLCNVRKRVHIPGEVVCLNLNKDFKEALKDTSIGKWLFKRDLDTTPKTAKELEKSSERLKVPKKNFRQPQGVLSRKEAQQSGKLCVPNSHQRSYLPTKHSQHPTGKQDRVSATKSSVVIEVGTSCGRLKYFIKRWQSLSVHKKILSYISGINIP
nr:unnamed protein product [Callosobruchus chinensis]